MCTWKKRLRAESWAPFASAMNGETGCAASGWAGSMGLLAVIARNHIDELCLVRMPVRSDGMALAQENIKDSLKCSICECPDPGDPARPGLPLWSG